MSKILEHLRNVLGMTLIWGMVWFAVAISFGTIIGIVDPDSIDPGEEPLVMGPFIGLVGLIRGVVFGILLLIVERQKTLIEISLRRAAMWGTLVAASLPLVAGKDIRMMLFLVPLDAISAVASVAIMQKWLRSFAKF